MLYVLHWAVIIALGSSLKFCKIKENIGATKNVLINTRFMKEKNFHRWDILCKNDRFY